MGKDECGFCCVPLQSYSFEVVRVEKKMFEVVNLIVYNELIIVRETTKCLVGENFLSWTKI